MDGKWDRWYFIPLFLLLIICQPLAILYEKIFPRWKRKKNCEHLNRKSFTIDAQTYWTCPDCGATDIHQPEGEDK